MPMVVYLSCVVEGKGEEQALPILIRRIAERIDPALAVQVPKPVLIKRNRLGELESWVKMAVRKLPCLGGVLILLDGEGDCPARLGPDLLRRAAQAHGNIPIGVVLAKHEFEAWFLASAESIGGQRGLSTVLQPPSDPEAVADAKSWLRRHMPANRKYSEPRDQPALTAVFDLNLARSRSDSFDKCYREIERLLNQLRIVKEPSEAKLEEKFET